jgi:hypothetical protein
MKMQEKSGPKLKDFIAEFANTPELGRSGQGPRLCHQVPHAWIRPQDHEVPDPCWSLLTCLGMTRTVSIAFSVCVNGFKKLN